MFPDAVYIAAVAHGDVAVIAAQNHLGTFGDDVAVIDTGIDGGFCAAVAHSFDFLNAVGDFHQPAGAGEELGLEISPETEAENGDIPLVYNGTELVDLCFGHELALIHDDDIAFVVMSAQETGIHVHIGSDDFHSCLQTDAAAENIGTVPGVGAGLDEPDVHIIFFVIVFGDQGLSSFAGTHGTVFKIELSQISLPPFPVILYQTITGYARLFRRLWHIQQQKGIGCSEILTGGLDMAIRITELHSKEVICLHSGQRLGFVCDVEVTVPEGNVVSLIVPGPCRFLGVAGRREDYVIPWGCIRRIGPDIILVEAKPNECLCPRPRFPLKL